MGGCLNMKKSKCKICVAGWHYFKGICKNFSKSDLDIYIIAHRHNKVLDELNLNYSIVNNNGLEFGCYNYYINNIWDGKSDVFFMHDDIHVVDFDNFIMSNYKKFKNRKADHGVMLLPRKIVSGGRFFYMSCNCINIIQKKYKGIWYDEENIGYVNRKSQPEGWHPRRYNAGAKKFGEMIKEIGEKYGSRVFAVNKDIRLKLYRRGKEEEVKVKLNSKEKKRAKKMGKMQKKRRRALEKEWKIKYGKRYNQD